MRTRTWWDPAGEDPTTGAVTRGQRSGGRRRKSTDRALARRLSAFPVFAECRQDDLEDLAGAGRVTPVPSSWTFLHEGTPADACYVLLEGQVRLLRGGVERASLGPGAVLGEMGLLGHSLRRASVVTSTRTVVLRVEYDALAALLRARPRLARSFTAVYDQHRADDARSAAGAGRPGAGGGLHSEATQPRVRVPHPRR